MACEFKRIIERALKRRGWTRYRLSQVTGIEQGRLCKYWAGKSGLNETHLAQIFKALRIEVRLKQK